MNRRIVLMVTVAAILLLGLLFVSLWGDLSALAQQETPVPVEVMTDALQTDEIAPDTPVEADDLLPGLWITETIDSLGNVGEYPSLELDSAGYPHISYYDRTNGDLKYAHQDSAGWHIETVDSTGDVGYWTSLALDQQGYPHIGYGDETNADMKYAYKDSSGWHSEVVDSAGGAWISLALDSLGRPHVSYILLISQFPLNANVYYSYRTNTGWHRTTVETYILGPSSYGVSDGTSIAIDHSDLPHISYTKYFRFSYYPPPYPYYYYRENLMHAYFDGSSWHKSTLDSSSPNGSLGDYSSLRLDSNQHIHVSYGAYPGSGPLRYYSSISGSTDVDDTWTRYTSLALNTSGQPRIAYQDYSNIDLKFAYLDSLGWHTQTIDSEGDVGYITSLEVGVMDTPTISYRDNTNGDLKLARYNTHGVFLRPLQLSATGGLGTPVEYTLTLYNKTPNADSFSLEFGPHAWETLPSTSPVGPIPAGASRTVTLSVLIPEDTVWYSTDSVEVIARSQNDPSQTSNAARLTTEAYAPPQISVDPVSLESTQAADQIVTQILNIRNGNGIPLTFEAGELIDDDLVAYYPFDGNARDYSGHNNDGTVMGAELTTSVCGIPDTAYEFDGLTHYIQVARSTDLDLTGNLSISAWIFVYNYPETFYSAIVDKDFNYTGYNLHIGSNGQLHVRVDGSYVEGGYISINQWHHVVGTYDGQLIKAYIDGVKIGETSEILPTGIAFKDLFIGSWQGERVFDGRIDDVRIYERALSEAEILLMSQNICNISNFEPWISLNPTSGTVPSNDSLPIQVTFDATDLQPDVYTTTLYILSSDPLDPFIQLPVTMTVLGEGIWLEPGIQAKAGVPDSVVTYTVRLYNFTNLTGTYSLKLSGNAWQTDLSATTIGPLMPGKSESFTISVAIPPDEAWYSTDTVKVIARSRNGPSQTSNAAYLTTQAYAPPQISLTSTSFSSTQYPNEIATQTLTIHNGNGLPLTFDIDIASSLNDPVLFLHLDEPAGSTSFADSSGNGYNGFCSGSTCPLTGVPGKYGYALDFDGSADFVQTTSFPLGGPISISAWVYSHNIHAYYARIIDFFDEAGLNNIVVDWLEETGRMDISVFNDNNQFEIHTEQIFPENQWVHVVAVIDADGTGYMYWNGELVESGLMQAPLEASRTNHYIARSAWGSDEYYNGLIDELMVFERALTIREIQTLYLGGREGADWLSVHPISGTVPTDGSIPIQVTFDATGLQASVYTGTLFITSNDPAHRSIEIPVTLTVLAGPPQRIYLPMVER